MIEPIQGEGGVRIPPDGFLAGLRKLADEHDLLLVFDEVQTGFGRTGHWFGYQAAGVTPDIMTLSKALCGGIAGAAMLATPQIAPSLRPGMHAATFGGNPHRRPCGHCRHRDDREAGPAGGRPALGRDLPAAAFRAAAAVRSGPRGPRPRRDDRHGAGHRRDIDGQGLPGTKAADQLHPWNGDPAAAGHDPHRRAGPPGLRHPRRSHPGPGDPEYRVPRQVK